MALVCLGSLAQMGFRMANSAVHGHPDTPEMREQIRVMLESEDSYVPGRREAEPFPG